MYLVTAMSCDWCGPAVKKDLSRQHFIDKRRVPSDPPSFHLLWVDPLQELKGNCNAHHAYKMGAELRELFSESR